MPRDAAKEVLMSGNQAKAVKFIAVLGGVLGAAVCAAMAFTGADHITAKILWLLLAVIFLLLMYPLYQVGNLAERVGSQEEKLKILANRQSKLSKSASDAVNKYSPMSKSPSGRGKSPTGASVSIPNAAERTIHYLSLIHI